MQVIGSFSCQARPWMGSKNKGHHCGIDPGNWALTLFVNFRTLNKFLTGYKKRTRCFKRISVQTAFVNPINCFKFNSHLSHITSFWASAQFLYLFMNRLAIIILKFLCSQTSVFFFKQKVSFFSISNSWHSTNTN